MIGTNSRGDRSHDRPIRKFEIAVGTADANSHIN